MPAPNRRNHGATVKVTDHAGASQVTDRRDRLKASQTRAASRWEAVAAELPLEQRAEQARSGEVISGRVKPPIVVLDRRQVNENQREALHIENAQTASSAAFRRVLDTACPAHGVKPGEPCWWPLDHAAVCDARIRSAGFSGVVATRSLGDKR